MASEVANMNGTYTQSQSQSYDHNYNSHSTSQSDGDFNNNASSATAQSNSNTGNTPEIPKDEVGWYFVEQYYTTLSRSPEKLYLFYNKRSQFVSGTEAEKVAVSVGQKSINERIKELDFQDCKVRVTNVDSQGSGSNIVIQVIGEISTKSLPQKKFTQTFVLAEQQNGYFVLNDIFRYLLDEDEEVVGEAEKVQQPVSESGTQETKPVVEDAPQSQVNGQDSTSKDNIADKVDKALEQAIEEQPALSADVAEDTPAAGPEPAEAVKPDEPMREAQPELVESAPEAPKESVKSLEQLPTQLEAEKPKDPEPTPVASPPKPAAAKPVAAAAAAPAKPAAPKTWASMLANRAPVPAIPAQASTPAAAPTPKAAPTTPAPAAQAATPTPSTSTTQAPAVEAPEPSSTPVSTGSEWQTAGAENKKARTQQAPSQQPEEGSRGYIKNVVDSIDGNALRAVLASAVKVKFLDISRSKNCAFVDYDSAADYQTAVAANPYEIDGHRLIIEERKFRPGGNPNFPNRGGRGGGQPNGQPGRGGPQRDGGRGGGFPNGRGRGGTGGGRGGRGGAQTTA